MTTLIQALQHALSTKDPLLPVETKRILLKEALQSYVLDFLYNHSHYRRLNFYGGTCLHIIYNLNRLSEDLDFDNGENLDGSHESERGRRGGHGVLAGGLCLAGVVHGYADQGGAIAPGPGDIDRGLITGNQTLVRIDPLSNDQADFLGVSEQSRYVGLANPGQMGRIVSVGKGVLLAFE